MDQQSVDRAAEAEKHAEVFTRLVTRLSGRHRYMFVCLKMVQLLVGASIPVAAAANASNVVVAVLGAVVVLLQGLDQLMQLGRRYIASADAAGAMLRETTLWKTRSGPYAKSAEPDDLFVRHVIDIESDWRAAFSELARKTLDKEDEAGHK